MKPVTLLVGIASFFCVNSIAAISAEIIDSFSAAGNGLDYWTPVAKETQKTFGIYSVEADGGDLDDAGDGYMLLRRCGAERETVGAERAIGVVDSSDVGFSVQTDISYLKLQGSEGQIVKVVYLLDGEEVDGSYAEINTFSDGNDPGGEVGLLSDLSSEKTAGVGMRDKSPVIYVVKPSDVGKKLSLQISFYDSSNEGGEGKRLLGIDCFLLRKVAMDLPTLGLAIY